MRRARRKPVFAVTYERKLVLPLLYPIHTAPTTLLHPHVSLTLNCKFALQTLPLRGPLDVLPAKLDGRLRPAPALENAFESSLRSTFFPVTKNNPKLKKTYSYHKLILASSNTKKSRRRLFFVIYQSSTFAVASSNIAVISSEGFLSRSVTTIATIILTANPGISS